MASTSLSGRFAWNPRPTVVRPDPGSTERAEKAKAPPLPRRLLVSHFCTQQISVEFRELGTGRVPTLIEPVVTPNWYLTRRLQQQDMSRLCVFGKIELVFNWPGYQTKSAEVAVTTTAGQPITIDMLFSFIAHKFHLDFFRKACPDPRRGPIDPAYAIPPPAPGKTVAVGERVKMFLGQCRAVALRQSIGKCFALEVIQ
ncbi:hypothetical protein C8Q77DRAFT_1271738, partial [Trametes polyzona]